MPISRQYMDKRVKIGQNLAKIILLHGMMKKILVLHGPNLNLLGTREPLLYGNTTLEHLNTELNKQALAAGLSLTCIQSNAEGQLIEAIHQAYADKIHYIIFNPAGYTHTSIALRDALAAVNIPFIEVHISNIYSREPFRHHSYFSDIARGTISGLGTQGYFLALTSIIKELERTP